MLQELDVQNAAAAEQHVKDMADYDTKVAAAAAAWEADMKKKKGKAKDEVSKTGVGHVLVSSLQESNEVETGIGQSLQPCCLDSNRRQASRIGAVGVQGII